MMRSLTLLIACACFIIGCEPTTRQTTAGYQTVQDTPRSDTARAQQHHAAGVELLKQGKLNEAEAELKAALGADLTYGPAHNSLGKLYFDQGKLYLAAWEFQYAIQSMPHQPEPRNNLGLVMEACGRLTEAVQQYESACELAPDHPEIIGNLARAKMRRGDQDPQLKQLLQDLIVRDQRPEWRDWAAERLSRMDASNESRP